MENKLNSAVDQFVSELNAIPTHWIDGRRYDDQEEVTTWPMWGTVWTHDRINADDIEKYGTTYTPAQIENTDDISEDRAQLYYAGWRELGDTGVYALEFDGKVLLGIDGAGYSFRDHWTSLYNLLGLTWHENRTAADRMADVLRMYLAAETPLERAEAHKAAQAVL